MLEQLKCQPIEHEITMKEIKIKGKSITQKSNNIIETV